MERERVELELLRERYRIVKLPWYQDFESCGFLFQHINFSLDPECVYFNQQAQMLYNSILCAVGGAVPGDIAEFGTFSGASGITLAGALRRVEKRFLGGEGIDRLHNIPCRRLHFFDSFEGMPLAEHAIDVNSPHIESGVWREGTMKAMSPEDLLNACAHFISKERIAIYKGFFKSSLKNIPQGTKFCLVHIDSDLYESAYDVLDYLFTHDCFSDGCTLLFDDWLCNRASPEMGEQRAWREICEKHNPRFTAVGVYNAMSYKFIIHR